MKKGSKSPALSAPLATALSQFMDQPVLGDLLTALNGGLLLLDRKLNVVGADRFCRQRAGAGREVKAGVPAASLFPALGEATLQAALREGLAGRSFGAHEFCHRPRAGKASVWLTATGVPVRDPEDRIAGVVVLLRDVTARRDEQAQADAELHRARRLLPLITECNGALLRLRDEPALLREICGLLVKTGGYRAAWVCLNSASDGGGLRLAAQCGIPADPACAGPPACAAHAQAACPLALPQAGRSARGRRRGRVAGVASKSARPAEGPPPLMLSLSAGNAVLGVLHLQPDPAGAPDAEETDLLAKLAVNLASRIEGLRMASQHRQAKNAIIETLRRFHVSVQASPLVAVQGVDRHGVVRQWNEASTKLYGYRAEEAMNRRWQDLLLEPAQADVFEQVVAAAWTTGQGSPATEWQVMCADGKTRWVFASMIPIREHDQVVELFCMEVDITERRQAEQALRDSEERYRNLVDLAPVAVVVHQDGTVRFANPTALELLAAHQPDDLCLRPVASFIHPDSQGLLEDLARAGANRPVELQLVRLDGGVVDVEVAALPLQWQDRPAVQWLVRDLTLTNRMQHELGLAREKLARIFESSPAAIAICSLADDRLQEANDAFLRLVGYERQEVLGRTLADLGIWSDSQPGRLLADARRPDGSLPSFEVQLCTKWRQTRHAFVSVDDIDYGTQPCRLFILIDVTDRKLLEAELRQSQKLEAMGQLARGVAHDLNNILTVIQGHQSLISLGRDLPRKVEDSLAGIAEAVERASTLTRQLLTFSRHQAAEATTVDLNEVIQNVTTMLRRIIGEDLDLQLQCVDRPCPVKADASMIEQVILNLAVNARDAMPRGGGLTLGTDLRFVRRPPTDRQPAAVPGDHVCLSVQDTGQGIPAENLARIFEPFFTTKEAGKGTGLGLATVRTIVHQHRGWIDVDSRLGIGTTFRVYLPAALGPRPVARDAAQAARALTGDETILLVEDETAVRNLAQQVLEHYGYRVLAAASGPVATRLWRKHAADIDLLLTDLVMPGGLDGAELADRFQAQRADLKVILATGYGSEIRGERRPDLSRFRLLRKPYSAETLARAVREGLESA